MMYPTGGAHGTAKIILCPVGDCVSGCAATGELETKDPKSKPEGIPLASLSRREAWGVLGIGSGWRGPRSEISYVSALNVKDVLSMNLNELIRTYNRPQAACT